MNHMDRDLRDLLDAAAGEPPQITVEAVRRRVTRRWAVQYFAVAAAAAVIAVIIPTGIGALRHTPRPSAATQSPAIVPARYCTARHLGVSEEAPGYGPIEEFAQAAGTEPNLVGYFSSFGKPFAVSFADGMLRRGLIPLVQIDPNLVSVSAIAAGRYDGYLSAYAEAVRAYRHSVIISFGHEMNGDWYSWGYGHTTPAVFVAAWRHIVNLFQALGAKNVTWMWTVNVVSTSGVRIPNLGPWWPGNKYVNWVGIDGYYSRPSDTFSSLFGPTIASMRTLTVDPILIAETAAPAASQPAKIQDLFAGISRYGLLGFVWFNEGQWRIEDGPLAKRAFRRSCPDRAQAG